MGQSALPLPVELPLPNDAVAARLEEIAELLEAQEANPYRVRAYRTAAGIVRGLDCPVHALLAREGHAGLTALHGIGDALANSIEELALTDHLALLERLRGGAGSAAVLRTVPGIGPALARRIREDLGIETLVELEAAAHDGRLACVAGMGERRVRAVRESLAGRFRGRAGAGRPPVPRADVPPVGELLDVDREYRERAEAGALPRIAPRREGPGGEGHGGEGHGGEGHGGEVWLPVLHTRRGKRHYTALWSNTARAHELGTTHDWVVVYRDDSGGNGQWTVVTEHAGRQPGARVVRGREDECAAWHGRQRER